ncbi:MAG TPA: hypothetical protein PLQ88_33685, partial [Blastocatellia bacterium]|nr:hypothetical protein [Blastocatellia bacterium]
MRRKLFLFLLVFCALSQPARVQEKQQVQPAKSTAEVQTQKPERTQPAPGSGGLTAEQFGQLSEKLSEPNGYFDSDNLISNETSYLHVMGKLRQMKLSGGAFIGVGPDQSFSYIAQIRPNIVFMVDIRRDNLLQHLLFKSLFTMSQNRLEYLCLLFGKPVPADVKAWDSRSIQDIVAYLDKTTKDQKLFDATKARVQAKVKSFGLKLDAMELDTINRIHAAFFAEGPDLKFTSKGRPSRYY